jgi:hypothetical protein
MASEVLERLLDRDSDKKTRSDLRIENVLLVTKRPGGENGRQIFALEVARPLATSSVASRQ